MKQPKKTKRAKRDRYEVLCEKRDRAFERVVALWENDEDVNHALDVLTLAHAAATFEFLGE